MKYIVILGDGMADLPVPELSGKTPLECANHPNMDFIARNGVCGLVQTVPTGMPPGSDTANLSAMGYDPAIYYTGRSPLEAVSMGIDLQLSDVTYRCNTVTLSDELELEDCVMRDYSAGEISTAESTQIIKDLNNQLKCDGLTLYPGVSYRHCLVLNNARDGAQTTPPHDILDRPVRDYLPKGQNAALLLELMQRSRALLKNHPVNQVRLAQGKAPVSCLWFWGEGRKPALAPFQELYGVRGSVISAVDLIKGIGICAGLNSIDVTGATGTVHTNFDGKAQAAIHALQTNSDFVYVHLEAPDECGHQHDVPNKVRSIELIDEKIIAPILQAMQESGEPFHIMVLPDHPTPLTLRTHTADPVPFALYRSENPQQGAAATYTEQAAAETGVRVEHGYQLMELLMQ